MAGNTARVDFATLRVQWQSTSSMFAICTHWSITKDQLVRLKAVAGLAPRLDRRARHRPDRQPSPSAAEIAASKASLAFAPFVAARVTCVQATWDDKTRAERQVKKPTLFSVHEVPVPEEAREFVDKFNQMSASQGGVERG